MSGRYDLIVNGNAVHVDSEGTKPLLAVLRDELGAARQPLRLRHRAVRRLHGADRRRAGILMRSRGRRARRQDDHHRRGPFARRGLAPLQQAFLDEQAGQCGYCLSGILVSAAALLARNPVPSRAEIAAALDPHLCRCGIHNRVIRRGRARRRHDQGIRHDPEHAAAEPGRQSAAVAMGRLRAGRPRPHCHRQGGDRARNSDRAHADRRRGARRRAGAAAHRLRRDRCQPAEGFTSGSYSIAVGGASLRLACAEVAFAVSGAGGRHARLPDRPSSRSPMENFCARAGRPAATTGRWPARSISTAATGTAPTKLPSTLSHRRTQSAAPRPAGEARRRGVHSRYRAGKCAACAGAAAALARRAPGGARRGRGAQGRQGADRDPARGRFRRVHGGERARGDARRRRCPQSRALGRRRAGPDEIGEPDLADGAAAARAHGRERASGAAPPGARGRGALFAPVSHLWLDRRVLRARRNSRTARSKVWSHSQGPAVLRDWLARALGLQAAQVTVFHRQGAGAYGHNTADDAAFDAAFIATRMPGRTVRVQWSREDEVLAAPISTAMAIKLRAVLDADSRPADWTIEIWSPPHAQRPGMNGNANLIGAEALPNAPPRKELGDVPDERGGGATRNAYADLRSSASPPHPSSVAARAAADLLAARARRLGQCVRDRILHGRIGRARRRGPGDATGCRSSPIRARAAWSRPRRR